MTLQFMGIQNKTWAVTDIDIIMVSKTLWFESILQQMNVEVIYVKEDQFSLTKYSTSSKTLVNQHLVWEIEFYW